MAMTTESESIMKKKTFSAISSCYLSISFINIVGKF